MVRTLPTSECVDVSIEWQFWVHECINERLKPFLKQDCPKASPNPETRSNPGPDCNPGLCYR